MRIKDWGREQEETMIPLELDCILTDELDSQPDCILLPYSSKRLSLDGFTAASAYDSICFYIDTTEPDFNISLAVDICGDCSIFQIELLESEYRSLMWLLLQCFR